MMDLPQTGVQVQLSGQDGNAFAVIGAVTKALKRAGLDSTAKAFQDQAFKQKSYEDLLALCMEVVEVS